MIRAGIAVPEPKDNRLSAKNWPINTDKVSRFECFSRLDQTAFDRNKVYSGFSFEPSGNTQGAIYYVWDSDKTDGRWTNTNILWFQLKFYF